MTLEIIPGEIPETEPATVSQAEPGGESNDDGATTTIGAAGRQGAHLNRPAPGSLNR